MLSISVFIKKRAHLAPACQATPDDATCKVLQKLNGIVWHASQRERRHTGAVAGAAGAKHWKRAAITEQSPLASQQAMIGADILPALEAEAKARLSLARQKSAPGRPAEKGYGKLAGSYRRSPRTRCQNCRHKPPLRGRCQLSKKNGPRRHVMNRRRARAVCGSEPRT